MGAVAKYVMALHTLWDADNMDVTANHNAQGLADLFDAWDRFSAPIFFRRRLRFIQIVMSKSHRSGGNEIASSRWRERNADHWQDLRSMRSGKLLTVGECAGPHDVDDRCVCYATPLSFTFDRKRLQALRPTITAGQWRMAIGGYSHSRNDARSIDPNAHLPKAALAKDKKKRAAKASIDPHKRPCTNMKPETPQDMRKTNKGKSKKKLQRQRPQSHPPSGRIQTSTRPSPSPRRRHTSPHMSTNTNDVNPFTRDDAAALLFDELSS
ncbi:hypothetical protein SDRG_08245 [Saprolegnia diclina VS20]|uniref:Uncharacterized protein n=1 Tax=Saprolegnia diclina (strain VS20) TaxID=1156394 RepID=T0Q850_SAPDV|nr:hypothetical protein SDRG_08245 [Saprolegnia diclina VS20]EQC34029.1 hypothetical protein SDRG_08245 [Saprolegnia diclina VS20]|eukprot:XP_008612341.1 hypothetical protein SDRG_08245 [Saprolegnia diclina VS20]